MDDWGSIPGRGKDFSLCHRVQTGSGTHPASYQMGTVCFFRRVKAAGACNWPLRMRSYNSTLPYDFREETEEKRFWTE
jgi:hypothetical protein